MTVTVTIAKYLKYLLLKEKHRHVEDVEMRFIRNAKATASARRPKFIWLIV
jgi:hypothetical protein